MGIFELLQNLGIAVGPAYQKLLRALIDGLIEPGDIAIDGGAGGGSFTIAMARRVAPSGQVFAIEPALELRQANENAVAEAGLSPYVRLFEATLGDSRRQATLYVPRKSRPFSSLSREYVTNSLRKLQSDEPIDEVSVDVVALDMEVLEANFLKLMIEGAEFLALKGAQRLLSSSDCFVYWEDGRGWPGQLFGYGADEFFDFFESIGYEPYTAFGEKLTREAWTDPQVGWQFYAYRPDYGRRDAVDRTVNSFWMNVIRFAQLTGGNPQAARRTPTSKTRVEAYQLSEIDQQRIIRWALDGTSGPPPEPIKRLTILDHLDRYDYDIVVETGTYRGDTSAALAAAGVGVHTIELSEALYRKACERFADTPNVTCHHGDSGRLLGDILDGFGRPAVLWLDGHYSMGETAKGDLETPIVAELGAIFVRKDRGHVVLIDDARCFGTFPDYPTLAEVERMVRRNLPNYRFSVLHDIIRLEPIEEAAAVEAESDIADSSAIAAEPETAGEIDQVLADAPPLHSGDGLAPGAGAMAADVLRGLYRAAAGFGQATILETGAGHSTLALLLAKPQRLISIALDPRLFDRIQLYCDTRGIERSALDGVVERSELALPRLVDMETPKLDLALIDGGHGWPTVFVDFCYVNALLKQGGILVLHALQLYSVQELARFLLRDKQRWTVVAKFPNAVFLRKETDEEFLPDYADQPYLAEKGTIEIALPEFDGEFCRASSSVATGAERMSGTPSPDPHR
jgi:FkbM family methyltransferase